MQALPWTMRSSGITWSTCRIAGLSKSQSTRWRASVVMLRGPAPRDSEPGSTRFEGTIAPFWIWNAPDWISVVRAEAAR
jgi:hypothetical protein